MPPLISRADLIDLGVPSEFHDAIITRQADVGPAREWSRHNALTRSRLSPADALGHRLWTGPMPDLGHPRAVLDGVRIDIVRWFAEVEYPACAFDPDLPLLRNTALCSEPLCFAPLHFTQPPAPRPEWLRKAEAERSQNDDLRLALGLYVASNPRPPSPTRNYGYLSHGDGTGLCSLGHPCKVYGAEKKRSKRSTYCPTCRQAERAWHYNRREFAGGYATHAFAHMDYAPWVEKVRTYLAEGVSEAVAIARVIAERNADQIALHERIIASNPLAAGHTATPDPVPDVPTLAERVAAEEPGIAS
jgi:hypothetical protein